ncbi:TonB-dependent receptor domain-containing protein [Ferrimonas marina]|uniref:TonB-dependent receptor n=1 Tax=Ferrimonas marina TaxID=299255 RepID=A0A1M5QYN0_9GAMM|nr:TonB-dependent receptor [Ferrimonas marina]SHH18819.1 TonB-dependent receptor [Ferrimonas marina]
MKTTRRFNINKVGIAITQALSLAALMQGVAVAEEQAGANDSVERIAVVGRLQRVASEVIEERRELPYVADLMGADQIGRTGDSDAAAALRRVTGLTLRDGKYIYVRGLGERYSSTSLNGAQVPSPDPTRSVIPLDLFPSSIIESLSVQKAASAAKPASFGGGHVDIRTKTIPNEFFFNLSVGGQYNSNNSDDNLVYNGGGEDWLGKDDGARALPMDPSNGLEFNRDMTVFGESASPGFRGSLSTGTQFSLNDAGDWALGFVLGAAYKNQTDNYEQEKYRLQTTAGALDTSDIIVGSEKEIKASGMFNVGLQMTDDHKIETFTTYLGDTSDEVERSIRNTENTIADPNRDNEHYSITYQERSLIANQIRGEHFFSYLWDLELNWHYTDARARRKAPNELSYEYIRRFEDDGSLNLRRLVSGQDSAQYAFRDLVDDTENTGFDLGRVWELDNMEITVRGGYDYFERIRDASGERYNFDNRGFPAEVLTGDYDEIFSDANVANPDYGFRTVKQSVETDDYNAVQTIDAGFGEIDLHWYEQFRITAGLRYEEFRQTVLAFNEDGSIYDGGGRYGLEDFVVLEDDWFPSLSATWFINDEMQLRAAVSQTVVRPDMREVAPVRFEDPLTGISMIGDPDLTSSDILNLDVRWEWYMESGSNLSVGAFYKDLEAPIEAVDKTTETDRILTFKNAEEGVVYGVELEFHQNFGFIDQGSDIWNGLFIAGNLTLSDSEITIADAGDINLTNPTRRMMGHSEWVANLQLSYDSPDDVHSATLVYNVFGDRIAYAGTQGFDDAIEQPFHSLDFTYTVYPLEWMNVKFKAKNILDEATEYLQNDERVFWNKPGTEYTLELGFKF